MFSHDLNFKSEKDWCKIHTESLWLLRMLNVRAFFIVFWAISDYKSAPFSPSLVNLLCNETELQLFELLPLKRIWFSLIFHTGCFSHCFKIAFIIPTRGKFTRLAKRSFQEPHLMLVLQYRSSRSQTVCYISSMLFCHSIHSD